jgi:hypothetical protein
MLALDGNFTRAKKQLAPSGKSPASVHRRKN